MKPRAPSSLRGIVEVLGARSRPEPGWISEVTGCSVEMSERAVAGVAVHAKAIRAMSEAMARTGRSYYAQFPAPIELYALVRLVRPMTIVESGVASGVSSAFMLMGAKDNELGTLHSIDAPVMRRKERGNEPWAIPGGLSSGWAIPRGLRAAWDIRLGLSEDILEPLLGEVGGLDFYCHDSPVDSEHFEFEMEAIRRHLKPGALVIADNTDWKIFAETARSLGAEAFRRRQSSLGAFRVPA